MSLDNSLETLSTRVTVGAGSTVSTTVSYAAKAPWYKTEIAYFGMRLRRIFAKICEKLGGKHAT